jgi:hypothetical protein
MKAYVATTATLFVLVTVVHVSRVVQESHLVRDPAFVLATAFSVALAAWALRLLQKTVRP